MGVDKKPFGDTPEEQAAWAYATEADGNPIDEFTPMGKLLMKTAFLAGIKWRRKYQKKKKTL